MQAKNDKKDIITINLTKPENVFILYFMNGKKLQLLRIERGLSQKDLEKIADVTDVTISSIECGRTNPSRLTLGKLAKALGFPVDEFME